MREGLVTNIYPASVQDVSSEAVLGLGLLQQKQKTSGG